MGYVGSIVSIPMRMRRLRTEWLLTLICIGRLDVINGQTRQTYKWEYIRLKHTDDGNLMVAAFLSQLKAKVQVFLEGHNFFYI